jgi:hypothetical protein
MSQHLISSWKEAQTVAPTVLERLNADPPLLMAAASNPILALEELGYNIAPSFREEFVDRVRFGTRGATLLRQLRKKIFSEVGVRFDLDSPTEIGRIIFDHLKLHRPAYAEMETFRAPDFSFTRHYEKEPLEPFRGQHPLVDSLLEYRQLNARAPNFATRELFDEIRAGKHRIPVVRLHARFKTAGRHGKK